MALKVIGGEFGGRRLESVRGVGTRPLLSQVREAVFNILGDRVENAEVWDLFAGTGATGIEALSRGARRVLFVEKSRQPLTVLVANLDLLGEAVEGRAQAFKVDAWEPPLLCADGAEGEEVPPDVVFLDPPYAAVAEDPSLAVYRATRLLQRIAPGGVLCFHFLEGALEEDDFDEDLEVDLRSWGTTAMALIERPRG